MRQCKDNIVFVDYMRAPARRNHKGYEEVRVPAVKSAGPAPGERVVAISEMEDWAQLAFAGYKCGACPAVCVFALPFALERMCGGARVMASGGCIDNTVHACVCHRGPLKASAVRCKGHWCGVPGTGSAAWCQLGGWERLVFARAGLQYSSQLGILLP